MSRLGRVYGKNAPLSARLSQRVQIEQAIVIKDGLGGEQRNWQELATVWAEVMAKSGREIISSGRIEPQANYKITIRYRDDVFENMRLLLVNGGEILRIEAIINPVQGDEILEIMASKGGEA